jgi:hypothetical protein
MRKYHLLAAAWVMIGSHAFGQTVEKGPNKLGLDIESVTVDMDASTAKIVVHNTGGVPITAYIVNLAPAYSDGEKLSGERIIDFFAGVGMKRLVPEGPGTDWNNFDAIMSRMSRESTFLYDKAQAGGAQLTGIHVAVTGVVFDDESTAGDSKKISEIAELRDAQSAEVARWCADVKRFSDGPVPRKTVDDTLAVHGQAPKSSGRQAPGQGAAEAEKKEMTSLIQQGLKWQSDDAATMDPLILDILDAKCTGAKEHLKKRGL